MATKINIKNRYKSNRVSRLKNIATALLPLSIVVPLLASCSQNYSFNSNVKAENAEEYFSASKVKIFTDEGEFNSNYQFVGVVEGDDCQKEPHLALPDNINARTKARQSAYLKQANAVIFTSCVDIDTKHCVAQVVCYAKAYRVGEADIKAEQ